MKRVLFTILTVLFVTSLNAQVFSRVPRGITSPLWFNSPFDGPTAADTTAAIYVGDIYLPSLSIWYKGDKNIAGDSLNVDMWAETWTPGVGWASEDHNIIRHMSNVSWEVIHDIIPPRTASQALADPANGANFTATQNVAVNDVLQGISFKLVTDTTTINRYAILRIFDSNDNIMFGLINTTAQIKSKSYNYFFSPGNPMTSDVSLLTLYGNMPSGIYLREGAYVQSAIGNLQTGDSIEDVVITSLRDSEPLLNYHLPTMADSLRFRADAGANNGSDIDIYLTVTAAYLQ